MKPGQSTFDERLSRINTGKTRNAADVVVHKDGPLNKSAKSRFGHLDMLAAGGLAGGTAGTLFAMNVGLLYLVTLNGTTLYELVMADYIMAAFIASVAIAPVGFVMSQFFARRNPRGWHFWIGYLGGVLAANATDIETYYYILTAPAA